MLQLPSCLFRLINTVVLFGVWVVAHTQSIDSIQSLKTIEVVSYRLDKADIGKHTDRLDSQIIFNRVEDNLASMLSIQTPLYVRSYGNGTLATLGIRGGNASHTQIVWNGIPLRNPMIGLIDLALVSGSVVDQVAVHYGGHGAAFGSGAVGGLISLANTPLVDSSGIDFHLKYGSWHDRSASVKLNYGGKGLYASTRVYSHVAKNDFLYRLGNDLPVKRQTNHQLFDHGLLQEIRWDVNPGNTLTGRVWLQNVDREIPPVSTQTVSKSAQQDYHRRYALQWSHAGGALKWQVKAAWLDEAIHYQDSLIQLYTVNQFDTKIAEAEMRTRLFDILDFAGGVSTEHVKARSANYFDTIRRNQHGAYVSFIFAKDRLTSRFQLREEKTDTAWSPLLVEFSNEWRLGNALRWKMSVSRNYRTPTLNDLYWRPGGNAGLVPEQGWTFETGFSLKTGRTGLQQTANITVYRRQIQQWIMWMPPIKDVRTFWSPINITEVYSRGVELRHECSVQYARLRMQLNTAADFTWSTFDEPLPEFGIEVGDQLFYVPTENLMMRLHVQWQNIGVYYQHHYFGSSPGINEDVKEGNVGNAGVSWESKTSHYRLTLYTQLENVWNVPYRLIERRPMPGRGVQIGGRVSL